MAVDAKIGFMNQTEKRLSTEITAESMNRVLKVIADILDGFDIREITPFEDKDDMIECFIEALRVQGRSEKTLRHYRGVLQRFLSETGVTARKVTVYHMRAYLAKKKEAGLRDSTMAHYREVFSSYFGWLFREGLIDKNPIQNLGAIKVPKEQKKIFSDVDMEKMRQNCMCLRDRAIVSFFASTGCRVGELIGLDTEAIDLENLECIVRGKGNKERIVYLDNVTAMYIRNYLSTRKDHSEALFVNRYGERFADGGIRDMLKRLEEVSGVEHVHPHKFRRTFATNAAKRGMPIQTIACILGHEKIETTMRYIVLNRDDVKLKYKQYYAS